MEHTVRRILKIGTYAGITALSFFVALFWSSAVNTHSSSSLSIHAAPFAYADSPYSGDGGDGGDGSGDGGDGGDGGDCGDDGGGDCGGF